MLTLLADPDNVNILEAAVTPPGENCVCEESLVHILAVTQSWLHTHHSSFMVNKTNQVSFVPSTGGSSKGPAIF